MRPEATIWWNSAQVKLRWTMPCSSGSGCAWCWVSPVAAQTRTMALGEPTTWHHRPTEVRYDREGRAYARGTVRHTEHRTLSLGKVWHRIERSRAVVSLSRDNRQWSGGGGFD